MWTDIVGGILALTGLGLAVNPEKMRKKLKNRSIRTVKRLFAAMAMAVGGLLISAGWQETGLEQKLLTGGGILALFKGVYFARSKSAELITERIQDIPGIILRLLAVAQISLGGWMILHEPAPEPTVDDTPPPAVDSQPVTEEA